MSNNTEQNFRFYPRPEAHSMKWDELLPPLRRALRDLLIRLDGAITKIDESIIELNREEVTANCFLVHGERGTGKSTILLSARAAVCKEDKEREIFFFQKASTTEDDKNLLEDAKISAKGLKDKGLIWLDVLDLESLTLHANLLTTMLTRLRNALCSPEIDKSLELTSILEEDAKSARHKLKQLINDATLMWEDIDEPDTRNKANRQIAAADIYAHFRNRFKDAMDTLSKELGRRNGMGDKKLHIVLPVDNIDRSTDHLHSIIKLAQMVAHPNLWLVLAGDREDVETFLERAYWKELISIGKSAGGAGKIDVAGEDEALVMARRQAAAASHKILPPSHRVEVGLVTPEDTLKFSGTSLDELKGTGKSIRELFEKIDTPNLGYGPVKNLLYLFDFFWGPQKAHNGEDKSRLTQAAQLSLQLPARGVLDLWQLAHMVVNDARNIDAFRAEKIARSMLRNIIAESKMPNILGQYLQGKVIKCESDGTTILDFRAPDKGCCILLNRYPLPKFNSCHRRMNSTSTKPHALRSTICAFENARALSLVLKYPAIMDLSGHNDIKVTVLPPHVTGWLIVLYDCVMQSEKSLVKRKLFQDSTFEILSVKHEVACSGAHKYSCNPKTLWWPVPQWLFFWAYDVFLLKWESFLSSFETHKTPESENKKRKTLVCSSEYLPWLLAVGWVACVLDTFWILVPEKTFLANFQKKRKELLSGFNGSKTNENETNIKIYESETMKDAKTLYTLIINGNKERVWFECEGIAHMKDWLEQKLPLLLSQLYVPMSKDIEEKRRDHITALLNGSKLYDAWRDNAPFILADIENELADMFLFGEKTEKEVASETISKTAKEAARETVKEAAKKAARETVKEVVKETAKEALKAESFPYKDGLFGNLHRFLNGIKKSGA